MQAHAEQLSLLGDAPRRIRIGPRHASGQERKATGQFKVKGSNEGWVSDTLDRLPKFLRTVRAGCAEPEFLMEQFRGFLKAERVPEPKHANAWGALANAASRAGLIRWTGRHSHALNPTAHARFVKVWVAA